MVMVTPSSSHIGTIASATSMKVSGGVAVGIHSGMSKPSGNPPSAINSLALSRSYGCIHSSLCCGLHASITYTYWWQPWPNRMNSLIESRSIA